MDVSAHPSEEGGWARRRLAILFLVWSLWTTLVSSGTRAFLCASSLAFPFFLFFHHSCAVVLDAIRDVFFSISKFASLQFDRTWGVVHVVRRLLLSGGP